MAEDLEKLEIEDVSSLTTGSVHEFREKVKNMDLPENDLKALKSAEEAGKSRKKALDFIDNEIGREKVSKDLDVAESDIEEIHEMMDRVTDLEGIEESGEETTDMGRDELIDLVGGTVDDIKGFVKDENPSLEVLNVLYSSEKKVKDRKTAKNFIERKIKQKKVENDLEDAREDIESLEEDIRAVEEDTSSEATPEEGESEKAEGGEESEADSEKDENQDGETEEKEAEEGEDSEDEVSELEEKKELAKGLDSDFSEEKLEEISIKELKSIRDEKERREELISMLEDEGLDSERLEKSSTSDLEKIAEEVGVKDKDTGGSSGEDEEKSEEEIREEAEEDLQMLMGAVNEEEDTKEDSGQGTREKIDDLRDKISSTLSRNSDSEDGDEASGMDDSQVEEVLDSYSDLENDEAVIKSAHIMKGYLETELGVERELTYKELAEEVPEDSEEMEGLARFFRTMHQEEYTQSIDISSSEAIKTCKQAVKML